MTALTYSQLVIGSHTALRCSTDAPMALNYTQFITCCDLHILPILLAYEQNNAYLCGMTH